MAHEKASEVQEKATAFDLLVEASRRLAESRTKQIGEGRDAKEANREVQAELGSFALSLVRNYIAGQLDAAFGEYWNEKHKGVAPGTLVLAKAPLNVGKGRIS